MKPSTALAIVTFVDARRPNAVGQRLPEALASLETTSYSDPVMIVDDGSSCERHLAYLSELERTSRYRIIRRPENGGISRAKNTCLRAIAETDAEIGFLAEDDIIFAEGWDGTYVDAMRQSGIQHLSWYLPDPGNRIVACNGGLITATSGLLGLLMTFTRDVVETIGGFKIFPHRYGYEHINWTYRAIRAGFAPFCADVCESSRVVQRNTHPSSMDDAEIQAGAAANRELCYEFSRVHEELQE